MNRNVIAGLAVLAVVLLGGAAYLATRPASPKASTNTNTPATNTPSPADTSTPTTSDTPATTNTPAATEIAIIYTDSGFSPANVTVKSGGTIKVTNNSSGTLQFDSDPHPSHTNNTELNIGVVAKGQSKTMVLSRTGTWGYHNHLSPGDTGKITVQ